MRSDLAFLTYCPISTLTSVTCHTRKILTLENIHFPYGKVQKSRAKKFSDASFDVKVEIGQYLRVALGCPKFRDDERLK